jgi:hypothetical protein
MKLSGWQRIGMVISILWVLVVSASGFDRIHNTFGYTIGDWLELPNSAFDFTDTPTYQSSSKVSAEVDCGNKNYDENYLRERGFTRSEAKARFEAFIHAMADGDDRVKAKPYLRDEVLQSYAGQYGCLSTPARYSDFVTPSSVRSFGAKGIALYGVGVALLGWMAAYLCLMAVRWVRQGFNSESRNKGGG